MSQQVNLYQPIFRRQRKVFSALTMLQLGAVVLAGLLLVYGVGRWQHAATRADLATLTAQRDAMQQQLDTLSREVAQRRDVSALHRQMQDAERAVAAKRQLLRWLDHQGGSAPQAGFAAHIEGLARQHRPGVQLTGIGVAAGGSQLRLAGRAGEAGDVIAYIRRLGDEAAFAGSQFRTVQLQRSEGGDVVEFVIASDRQDSGR